MTDDLKSTPEYRSYLRAREAVLRMKGVGDAGAATDASPSAYWTEELDNIDYLADASPLIIRKLRHHAFHITGIRPYDYRVKEDDRAALLEARLRALQELGGDAPLVPESPALGGYGFRIDGQLFNVDTLKFYEVFVGMRRGGVLQAIRGIDRPVVCEIGAGWAGFAYSFKTAFPRTTYVIVDFPELFLFSATYLGAVFPNARLHFVTGDGPAALEGWRDADFVFVPNTLSHLVSTLPLDLTVNMVSFQEMTDAQVRGYASMAAKAGCPLLYSLNRERSLYNSELVSVSEALSTEYRLTEVPLLETDYTGAMKKPPKKTKIGEASASRYRHFVGHLDPRSPHARAREGASSQSPAAGSTGTGLPRVVLGMTLYNKAPYLREAIDSLLAQTFGDFALLLLDDASTDGTEAIAREYEARDSRVRYIRHASRQAMIATWREVAEIARRDFPDADFFAWVSDHDRWHPRWLQRMVVELDGDPGTVLAYPITVRMSMDGVDLDKGPRLFETADARTLAERWHRFCADGTGAGDMVYGVMRAAALQRAGIFRPVLRPDRLLVAELTLQGRIRQVPEVLWHRRQSEGTSVERQSTTLMLPGTEPSWFNWPPWYQHCLMLWREQAQRDVPGVERLSRSRWLRMLFEYQRTYAWRHLRKTETSHALARAVSRTLWVKKVIKRRYHQGVYTTLVGVRSLRDRSRRAARRTVYEVLTGARKTWRSTSGRARKGSRKALFDLLTWTHRVGLRGRDGSASR